jgi:16S rRNA (guanine527-N7)-methyltransferase
MSNIQHIITTAAIEMGINLPTSAVFAFERYCDILIQRGELTNLTAIKDRDDIARLHFLDSLALLKFVDFKDSSVLDVGSGAGFPGVPLIIAEPSIKLTLLDSANKRIAFLSELCDALIIEATCIQARAEDASRLSENAQYCMREQFDFVVSRAVARLNVLCELCLPFLRVGGTFPAMKSLDSDDELDEARNAIALLGGELADVATYEIPDTDVCRRVIIIRKIAKTPVKYPRRFARIEKKTL